MQNKDKREAREAAQVLKEKNRVEKESEFNFVDTSVDSSGAGVNTTNTDKSMESIKEQITPFMPREKRRTKSGEA